MSDRGRLVLVTGVTGYIGGRLVRPLAAAGYRVRAAARKPAVAAARFGDVAEVVAFDSLDPTTYADAVEGVDTVFYLVRSLSTSREYARLDREAASAFARAARETGVRRIIYLGGLGQQVGTLSEHLGSRQEVGRILAEEGLRRLSSARRSSSDRARSHSR